MNLEIKRLIEFYGSQSKLATVLGVHRAAVNQWLVNGNLPPLRAIQIEMLTGGEFKAVDLNRENKDDE